MRQLGTIPGSVTLAPPSGGRRPHHVGAQGSDVGETCRAGSGPSEFRLPRIIRCRWRRRSSASAPCAPGSERDSERPPLRRLSGTPGRPPPPNRPPKEALWSDVPALPGRQRRPSLGTASAIFFLGSGSSVLILAEHGRPWPKRPELSTVGPESAKFDRTHVDQFWVEPNIRHLSAPEVARNRPTLGSFRLNLGRDRPHVGRGNSGHQADVDSICFEFGQFTTDVTQVGPPEAAER